MDALDLLLRAAERKGFLAPGQEARAREMAAGLPGPDAAQRAGRALVAAGLLSEGQLAELVREEEAARAVSEPTLRAPPGLPAGTETEATLRRPAAPDDRTRPAAAASSPADATEATLKRAQPPAATDHSAPSPAPPVPPAAPAADFRYEPRETLGRGGMGFVRAALDPSFGREVAIKQLLEPGDASARARFLEEAQVTGQLEHPNIIPVHDLGVHPTKGPFLVMKRVRGRSLKAALSDLVERKSALRLRKSSRRAEDGSDGTRPAPGGTTATQARGTASADPAPAAPPAAAAAPPAPTPAAAPGEDAAAVPLERALPWLLNVFVKVCEAMAYAHARGVIHRDLKPENIMVGEFGEVHVMDWGLAKVLGRPETRRDRLVIAERAASATSVLRTLDGEVIGTPMYMPPEQAEGRVDALDERSDLYSLGVILYEILALNQPFEAKDLFELLRLVRAGTFEPPRKRSRAPWDVPRDLEAVALKAMARDPAARYAGVLALKSDVEAFLAGRRLSAAEYSSWDLLVKWARRNKAAVATGSAAAALLLVAGVLFVLSLARETKRAQAAERDALRQKGVAETAKNAAEASEHAAQESERAAEASAREAAIRLAEGKVHEGDALLASERWNRAIDLYQEARAGFTRLGVRTETADWGLTSAYRFNSPPILVCDGLKGPLRGLAVLPDGRRFLAGGAAPLTLVEAVTGRCLRTYGTGENAVQSLAVSSDGARALVGGPDGGLTLWEVETGRLLMTFRGHRGTVNDVAFSPDGRVAAAGDEAGVIRLWDPATGTELRSMDAHPPGKIPIIGGVAFSPDGRVLISGSSDWTVKLWEVATGRQLRSLTSEGSSYVGHVRFTPDGRHAVAAVADKAIRYWDLESGTVLEKLAGQTNYINDVSVLPDGRRFLSCGEDQMVKLWDLAGGGLVRVFQGHRQAVARVAVLPDGRKALSAGEEDGVRLWDLTGNHDVHSLRGHHGGVARLACTPDGRRLLSVGADDLTLRLWDLESGQEIRAVHGLSSAVCGCVISSDGRRAVTSEQGGDVKVWNLLTGEIERSLRTYWPTSVALSGDARRIATGGQDGTLRLWERESGRLLWEVPAHNRKWIAGVAFTPDGRGVLSGGKDGGVRLWNVEGGALVRAFEGHTGIVGGIAVSPDGRTLATAASDQTVRTWELASGRPLLTIRGHRQWVHTVAFTPDGRHILSSANDETLRRWDAASGEEVHIHRWAGTGVSSSTILPGGDRVAAAVGDGSLTVLDFAAAGRYRDFDARLVEARRRLAERPEDAEALRTFGEWYAFRQVWDWSVDLLERARRGGAQVGPLTLARGYWCLGRLEEARRELRRAGEAAGKDAALAEHVRLCLEGVELSAQRLRRRDALLRYARPAVFGRQEGRLDEASAAQRGVRLKFYSLHVYAGEHLRIRLSARDLVPVLFLVPPDGEAIVTGPKPGETKTDLDWFVADEGECVLGCRSTRAGESGEYVLEVGHAK